MNPLAGALLFLLVPALSAAAQESPLVEAARALGRTGFRDAAAPEQSPTKFKPDGKRRVVAAEAKLAGDDDAQRKAFEEIFLKLLENYEKTAAELGQSNDASAALAFSVSVVYAAATEKDLDDQAFLALIPKLQASLDVAAVRNATDVQKQEYYERVLCASGTVLAVAQVAETAEAKAGLKKLAGLQLQNLLGVTADRLTLKGKEVAIKAAPAAPAAGGIAEGFTFTPPQGWKVEGAWHVLRNEENRGGGPEIRSALIRFPPAIDAAGDMGVALRNLWKTCVPEELAGRHSTMVFRRYVGDGLMAQFVHGSGIEKGRPCESAFTLYLIDLGARWQPMVVAQTYEEPGNPSTSIVQMMASMSFAGSARNAEAFLATLRCPAAKGRPLVSKEALVGDYSYGASSSLQWANIYTGATTMTMVSYGGTLTLKEDGTYTYTFVGTSGAVGAMNVSQDKSNGRWEVVGDLLTCTAASGRDRKYRVAGLTQFDDGVKVAVLLSRMDLEVNPTNVNDRADWFSTKKK